MKPVIFIAETMKILLYFIFKISHDQTFYNQLITALLATTKLIQIYQQNSVVPKSSPRNGKFKYIVIKKCITCKSLKNVKLHTCSNKHKLL